MYSYPMRAETFRFTGVTVYVILNKLFKIVQNVFCVNNMQIFQYQVLCDRVEPRLVCAQYDKWCACVLRARRRQAIRIVSARRVCGLYADVT